MPNASKLTEYVKGADESFALSGISCRSIEKKVVRSKTVINNLLRFKDKYRNKNAVDRRKVLLNRGERGVLKLASTGKCSSKEIFQTIGLKMYKKIICNTVILFRNFNTHQNCLNPFY